MVALGAGRMHQGERAQLTLWCIAEHNNQEQLQHLSGR